MQICSHLAVGGGVRNLRLCLFRAKLSGTCGVLPVNRATGRNATARGLFFLLSRCVFVVSGLNFRSDSLCVAFGMFVSFGVIYQTRTSGENVVLDRCLIPLLRQCSYFCLVAVTGKLFWATKYLLNDSSHLFIVLEMVIRLVTCWWHTYFQRSNFGGGNRKVTENFE